VPATRSRILVVDDAATIREVLKVHLRNAGYEVVAAEDAVLAARIVLDDPPGLIIVDAKMPYMSGYELAAALVGDEQTRHIPVILLTSDPEGEARARELGLAAFLAKPVSAEHLLRTVARFAPVAAAA
jgi:chemosensory pili system protein ChpA (sensor histidine kinase/response regulator)